jgi:beta-lactamase superfamily II metal-dependent hydrolase
MYNVGFGDCFLVNIPTPGGERRMLVDCGYHSQGKGKFNDRELVMQIQEDLQGAPIDVVVATHRHQDHISGFGESDLWTKIGVEEVWLPFTASPDASREDPALKAWYGLMARAERLIDGGKLSAAATLALGAREEHERRDAEFMLWNARANGPGIQNLLAGLRRQGGGAARRRFLPEDAKCPSLLVTPALPGVTTYVLGPPRDPKLRKSRKVPSDWGLSDGVMTSAATGGALEAPFGDEWRVEPERLPAQRPFQEKTLNSMRKFSEDLLHAARAVDGFLNGESLVLVVEFGRARLLLPGDAEVGTWSVILDNGEALAMAASATFFKVGHHGSHNATPLVFVRDHLAKGTSAVISTQKGGGNYRNGIPFDNLLAAMSDRGLRYVRSDDAQSAKGVFVRDSRNRWIDCEVPC